MLDIQLTHSSGGADNGYSGEATDDCARGLGKVEEEEVVWGGGALTSPVRCCTSRMNLSPRELLRLAAAFAAALLSLSLLSSYACFSHASLSLTLCIIGHHFLRPEMQTS